MPVVKRICLLLLLICYHAQAAQDTDAIDINAVSLEHVVVADISKADQAGKTFVAETLINSSVEKLCAAIMDYPAYPQFMPNTQKVDIISSAADATIIAMTLKLPLGKTKKYRLRMTSTTTQQSCHLAWQLVPAPDLLPAETIADTTGYWQLEPYALDASKTLVTYKVYADPGPIPFGLGWIVELLSKISLPRTLEALRERVGAP